MSLLLACVVGLIVQTRAPSGDPAPLIGLWRGTSTCVDRVAAPACQNEIAVYEFTPADTPGTVHWIADKEIDGKRVHMGDAEAAYDAAESCWKAEIGPRARSVVWRLSVDGTHLTGTARLLPGQEIIRRIDLRKR